jgi:hypothetical protein
MFHAVELRTLIPFLLIFTDIFAQTVKSLDKWVALPSVVTVGFPLGKVLAFRCYYSWLYWCFSLVDVNVLLSAILVFVVAMDVMGAISSKMLYWCNIFKPNPRVRRRVFPHWCPCGGPDILFENVDDVNQF